MQPFLPRAFLHPLPILLYRKYKEEKTHTIFSLSPNQRTNQPTKPTNHHPNFIRHNSRLKLCCCCCCSVGNVYVYIYGMQKLSVPGALLFVPPIFNIRRCCRQPTPPSCLSKTIFRLAACLIKYSSVYNTCHIVYIHETKELWAYGVFSNDYGGWWVVVDEGGGWWWMVKDSVDTAHRIAWTIRKMYTIWHYPPAKWPTCKINFQGRKKNANYNNKICDFVPKKIKFSLLNCVKLFLPYTH